MSTKATVHRIDYINVWREDLEYCKQSKVLSQVDLSTAGKIDHSFLGAELVVPAKGENTSIKKGGFSVNPLALRDPFKRLTFENDVRWFFDDWSVDLDDRLGPFENDC